MKQEDIDNLKVGDYIGRIIPQDYYNNFYSGIKKIVRETKTKFVFEDKTSYLKKDLIKSEYKTKQIYIITLKRKELDLKIIDKIKNYNIPIKKLEQIVEILDK